MRVRQLSDTLPPAEASKFKSGDRVKVTAVPPHDPYHKGVGATVVLVNPGPAYGLLIDGMESMGTHKWYVGDELGQGLERRTIGPIVIVPDIIMGVAGLGGVIGSLYIKSPTASMVALMLGSMAFAVAIHGALMRLTESQVGAELNCPPGK